MKKPNILFILADDQRFDTIAALGNTHIKTPNLDTLVKNSTTFTHAHIPGGTSGAVCMPSRAMLHTGRTAFHIYGVGETIPQEHTTMGECFTTNGYKTIGIGKWHNGTESYARSFTNGDNIFFGGMWDHWNVPICHHHADGKYKNHIKSTPNFFHANHPLSIIAESISAGVHSTDLLMDCAIDFLKEDYDSPFMLYLSLLAPHDPRTMPKEFQDMYKPTDIDLPESFLPDHPFFFGSGDETRDEALANHPRGEIEIKQHICDYYAMISHIDYKLGQLIETLKKTGKLENTIIVYTGDNGLALGKHGLMGKQNLYDHSVRVPLIISGPNIEKNKITANYVYLLDIYPTLCDLADVKIPHSVEGLSFKKILQGDDTPIREDLYFAYVDNIRAVKDSRYKLIEYRLCRKQSQLYDLLNDPQEIKNLYNDKNYATIVKKLTAKMLTYKAEWEDTADSKFSKSYWDSVRL